MRSIMESVRAGLRRALPPCAGVVVLLLAACAVPEAPEWDVGMSVPFSSDPITIVDFLPSVVDTASIGGQPVFTVDIQQDSVAYTLGQMCSLCVTLQGLTAPVPSFDYVDSLEVRFPADLVSVEVLSAQLGLWVFNGLNFDPLRPGAGGFVTITARDLGTGVKIDSVLIDGASETLPAGTRTQITLNVTNADITDGVRVVVNVHSPSDGQTVTIDNNLNARFGAFLDQIRVAAVTVVVDNKTLDEQFSVGLDADLRDQMADRVQSGAYELELTHNLDIAGALDVSIAGSTLDLFSGDPLREVRLDPMTFTPGVKQTGMLTGAEIQQIADFLDVYVGYRGAASGTRPGNQSRFTPEQELQVKFKLEAVVRVGK